MKFFLNAFLLAPLFVFSQDFSVRPTEITFLTASDSTKMFEALKVFQLVMNDSSFQKRLRDTTFVFDLPDDPMRHLTSDQVVDTLFSGKEWYSAQADRVANIIWSAVKRPVKPPFSSAIGYGNPGDSMINTYVYYIRRSTLAEIAGHVAHEWSHKMGFDHQPKDHPTRDQTVPYLFGNLVTAFGTRYQIEIK